MQAFETIYKRASGFVYNLAFRITYNAADAQEVTQDVFLKVYHNLKRFRFQSSFKTWVYRIATNAALDALKRRRRSSGREIEYDDNIESAASVDPDEAFEKAAKQDLVGRLLTRLNPDQRSCVILRDIEGLSYREIAQTLKLNLNTVRSRLKRARDTLIALRKKGAIKYEL